MTFTENTSGSDGELRKDVAPFRNNLSSVKRTECGSALAVTSQGLIAAITGKVRQTVHVVRSVNHAPLLARHTVLVIPAGQKFGEYFTCGSHALAALREGWSPEELELELDPEEE